MHPIMDFAQWCRICSLVHTSSLSLFAPILFSQTIIFIYSFLAHRGAFISLVPTYIVSHCRVNENLSYPCHIVIQLVHQTPELFCFIHGYCSILHFHILVNFDFPVSHSSLEIANTPAFHCPHPKTHRHPNFSIHKPLSALMHFHSSEPYFSNRHCSITSSPSSVMTFWGQRLIQR